MWVSEQLHLQKHAAIKLVLEEVGQAHLEAFDKDFLAEAGRIAGSEFLSHLGSSSKSFVSASCCV